MRSVLALLLAGTAGIASASGTAPAEHAAAADAATATAPATTPSAKPAAPTAALPPFAAELAQRPPITDAGGWQGMTGRDAWTALAQSTPQNRQSLRWRFALGLIGEGRGAEALGVLDVMGADDQDLALVAPYQLARGVALTMVGRDEDAVKLLAGDDLSSNAEACAWRMRALSHAGDAAEAARQINCALPAINGRAPEARAPFVLAASEAAIRVGQAKPALEWLRLFNDRNPAANALRGRAMVALGDVPGGRLRLERAEHSGPPPVKADARLGLIEAGLASHALAAPAAVKRLDDFRYDWRGGPIEERALRLELKLATEAHDLRGQLRAAATLFRYFKLGKEAGQMLAGVQAGLKAALAPDGGMSLPDAAGLYWDYRELAPSGAEGDAMAVQLANRLQSAGLYGRAAELLQYQLTARTQDVAQGPLSVKVASLHILSGHPDRALQALLSTEQPSYTEAMRQDRKRMEAVALYRLGREAAAMAAIEGLPDAAAVKAEMHWRTKNWGSFVSENEAGLPAPKGMDEPAQAAVLRQAVALAMLGQEARLQALRARYATAFKTLRSGQAFDVLTRDAATVDPASLSAAMAAIPEASPEGAVGDLLDATS